MSVDRYIGDKSQSPAGRRPWNLALLAPTIQAEIIQSKVTERTVRALTSLPLLA
jgi:hypothetical protein